MSTSPYRVVPRYPAPTTEDYAGWLADGQKGASGIIDIADGSLARGYIQPDEFPDERIYFSYKSWPLATRRDTLVGRQVRFDMPPTEYDPRLKPMAVNVVLV